MKKFLTLSIFAMLISLVSFGQAGPIIGPDHLCVGATGTYTDTSGPGIWTISPTSVATITGSTAGIVTGVSAGVATISYFRPGAGGATRTITINPLPAPISGPSTVFTAGTITLTDASVGGTWASSCPTILTIGATTGIVTGVGPGACMVTYTLPTGCSTHMYVFDSTGGVAVDPIVGPSSTCVGSVITLSDATSGGTWSSSNPSIATITSTGGVLTGISAGTCNITYSVGTSIAFTTITVYAAPTISGLHLLCAYNSITLTATPGGGVWSSGSTLVATVTSTGGVVTGVAPGNTNIYYSLSGCYAYHTVTVNAGPSPISGSSAVAVGGSITLSDATSGGVWSSSNSSVGMVGSASGIVTGISNGVCTITYTLGGCYVTKTVTVGTTSSISAITGAASTCVGSSTTLTDATPGGTWSSSNTSIATITSAGIVTGVSAGTCTITYTVGSSYVTTTFVVISSATVAGPGTVCVGSSITLTSTPSGGTWSSGNTSLATVTTTGVVTGVAPGVVNIYYTVGSCYSYRSVTVTAMPATIGGATSTTVGGTATLTDATSGGIWSSSNTSIATISATSGVATGVSVGSCIMTYSVGGCYRTVVFTVTTSTTTIFPITGPSSVCVGSYIILTDSTVGGTWSSSNTAIATVTSSGVVIGVSAGSCIITYSVGTSFVTRAITVTAGPAAITGTLTTTVGGTSTLSDATSGGSWSSSSTGIATVNATTGVVTGVSAGTCTITYYISGCFVTAPFTVTGTTTTISPITGPTGVCVGSSVTLFDSTSGGTWSSSNTSIATVGASTGIVTGVSSGVCTITYTVGSSYVTRSIAVNPLPGVITGTTTTTVGGTSALSTTTTSGTWTSSNTGIATVNATSGVVTGVSAGTCTITFTSGGCFRTVTFVVTGTTTIASITGPSAVCTGASITLADATAGGTWTSSNTSIATVNITSGVVTGISAGTCTITYTVGTSYVTTTITVSGAAPITGTLTTTVGGTSTLSDATTGGVWISSNTAIATISTSGVVTGVSAGTCTISYYISGCIRTVTFTVTGSTSVLPITGSSATCIGSTTTLFDSTSGGTWSSSNTAIATVSSAGVVTGVSAGTCTITYTVGTAFVTHTITVSAGASITGGHTVCVGSTLALTGTPSGGTWNSSNTAVATVSTSGIVTGVTAGTVNIYYSSGGCYAYNTVTVNAAPTISGSSTVCIGSTTTLTGSPSGGTWSSSSIAVATVSTAGIVSGITAGVATITYTSGGCAATKTVTVTAPPTITGGSTLCVGNSMTLSATPLGGTWSSGNTAIATVSSTGVVTAVGSGVVNIYYFFTTACAAYRTVTVNAAPTITGSSTVCAGATITLGATPSGGTWSSSSTATATVSTSGVVTGVTAGVVNIYYYSGGCYTVKTVTVNGAVISGSHTVCLGGTTTLTASPSGGTWSSSSTATATVSSAGVVTGVTAGTVNIYYLSGGCYSYYTMTVNATASITGGSTVCAGSTITLTASPTGGTWSTSSSTTATVSTAGVVTGIAAGTVTIYYNSGGCYAYRVVTVNAAPSVSGASAICIGSSTTLTGTPAGGVWSTSSSSTATVSSTGVVTGVAGGTVTIYYGVGGCYTATTITVGGASITGSHTLCAGSTTTLSGTPGGGTWSSSGTSVVTVSSAGVVTGIGAGTANIYYLSGGCYSYFTVTVNAAAAITGSHTTCVGGTTTLSATPSGGSWSSSTAIATVTSAGLVTGVAAGVATISYNTTTGCSATFTVTVSAATSTITGAHSVCVGSSTTLVGTPSGGTWASGYTSIATVSSGGLVTGVTPGSITIYYSIGGCYAYTSFTVNLTPAPIAGPSSVCVGNSITLSDATTGGTWSTSSSSVASITTAGVVTGVSTGVANIYYSIGYCSVYRPVSVSPAPAAITGGTSVMAGSTLALYDATTGGTWTSGNTAIATVNPMTGLVTGVAVGTVNIYYSLGSGCVVYITITVTSTPFSAIHFSGTTNDQITGTATTGMNLTGRAKPTSSIGIGSDPVAESSLTVFPNPTSGNLNIKWENLEAGNADVIITDIVGRVVYNTPVNFNAASGQAQIVLSGLKDGVYLISIKSEGAYFTSRLTIQH